jgi:hypothetical protein
VYETPSLIRRVPGPTDRAPTAWRHRQDKATTQHTIRCTLFFVPTKLNARAHTHTRTQRTDRSTAPPHLTGNSQFNPTQYKFRIPLPSSLAVFKFLGKAPKTT